MIIFFDDRGRIRAISFKFLENILVYLVLVCYENLGGPSAHFWDFRESKPGLAGGGQECRTKIVKKNFFIFLNDIWFFCEILRWPPREIIDDKKPKNFRAPAPLGAGAHTSNVLKRNRARIMAPNSPDLAVFLLTSSDLTDYNVHPFRKFVFSRFCFSFF